ncbi:hypothetical protein TTHERM_00015970 (macronuclear) [Tetrahymena thermophila SB210]|uniref:Transmembrane protein n=1 Tax=Tetrahymena thermophila (strain SB210) TaxID=312017 RepID=Q22RJ0_TETTS|nr:hypothetical protein TTHERM_00015970 [Tetrahymena thermophila SB210]EAR88132.2 hypothetical protein TTHERM_00015970 [Tetrahymena thermophila SB210]|eukprot:XP_001008377.2 hypothetical protein TTHERM_00015970 [Tetrahymena thermophila SB210]
MKKIEFLLPIGLLFLLTQVQSKNMIDNCSFPFIVYQNPQNTQLQMICQECKFGYIVDYDFKSCIEASILPMPLYSYCKRLDRNRECDEAYTTIQIDHNELFVTENPLQYDPRCSKIDTVNKICISPRFPYTLDISQDLIFHFPDRFCKITNGQTCIQNYELFYKSKKYNTYYGLFNLINPNKITNDAIYDTDIQCMQNFAFKDSIGCIPINFQCLKNNGITCTCSDGEAIDSTGSACTYFQNCLTFGYAGLFQFCMQCQSGYFNSQGLCTQSPSQNTAGSSSTSTDAVGNIYIQLPLCNIGYQLDYKTFSMLKNSITNFIKLQIIQTSIPINIEYNDPIYLLLLSFAIDFAQDQSYSYYFNQLISPLTPQNQFGCMNILNQIQGCTQYMSNLCFKCERKGVYYVQTQQPQGTQLFQTYQSFCGQSEDLGIPNCRVIAENKCIVCNDQYFLLQNECIKGQTPYCIIYDTQENCLLCQQQYIMQQGKCYPIPMIKNCLIYSYQNPTYCYQCIQNYILFQYNGYDNTGAQCIKNDYSLEYYPCVGQSQDRYCSQCGLGSSREINTQQCYPVYYEYFCLQLKGPNKCLQCQNNYILVNGICYYQFYKSGDTTSISFQIYYQYQVQLGSETGISGSPYTCDSSTLQNKNCQYLNQQGYYLNQLFTQRQCYIQQQGLKCNKCFKNICLDKQYSCKQGYGWSQTFQKCLPQCLNGMLQIKQQQCNYRRLCNKSAIYTTTGISYQCSDCSIVTDIKNCQQENDCEINEIYSFKFQKCMKLCGNGVIADTYSDCKSSNICQDGLDWISQVGKCAYLQNIIDSKIYVNQTTQEVNDQQKDIYIQLQKN